MQSGKTAGKIQRALRSGKKATPSSERRPLRAKNQPRPSVPKERFPLGKYHTQ